MSVIVTITDNLSQKLEVMTEVITGDNSKTLDRKQTSLFETLLLMFTFSLDPDPTQLFCLKIPLPLPLLYTDLVSSSALQYLYFSPVVCETNLKLN